jgi:hypothetical protein
MQVGDVVYRFDRNHRVYAKAEGARFASSGPIYREHFRPAYIVGEEGRSWLVSSTPDGSHPRKIGKAKAAFLTAEQVDADCWVNGNRHHVCALLQRCTDADTIKAVAALLGYSPEIVKPATK